MPCAVRAMLYEHCSMILVLASTLASNNGIGTNTILIMIMKGEKYGEVFSQQCKNASGFCWDIFVNTG